MRLPRRAEGALGVHRDRPVLALDVRAQERAAHLVGEGRGDRDQTFTRARLEEDEAVRPLDRELQESFRGGGLLSGERGSGDAERLVAPQFRQIVRPDEPVREAEFVAPTEVVNTAEVANS